MMYQRQLTRQQEDKILTRGQATLNTNKKMNFKQYKRKGLSEMIPFKEFIGQDLSKVSVSEPDKLLSNEEFEKGFIARNPKNHDDMWYVAKKYFDENLEETTGTDNLGEFSDGYHTFNELYEFRKVYNAALFNEWAAHQTAFVGGGSAMINAPKYNVHKSWRHHDGELCFGGGWFIVVAMLPTGQITNHYEAKDWDLFKIPETEKALFEFDGHTSQDVINRLLAL